MLRRRTRFVTLAAAAAAAEDEGGGYGVVAEGPRTGAGAEVEMEGPWWELVSRGETGRESAPEEWDDDGEDSFAGRGVSGGMRRKGGGRGVLAWHVRGTAEDWEVLCAFEGRGWMGRGRSSLDQPAQLSSLSVLFLSMSF